MNNSDCVSKTQPINFRKKNLKKKTTSPPQKKLSWPTGTNISDMHQKKIFNTIYRP